MTEDTLYADQELSLPVDINLSLNQGPTTFAQPTTLERQLVSSLAQGNYTVGQNLGRGAEGYVQRLDLSQEDLQTRLAVKVVSTRHHSDQEICKIIRQAELMRRVSIPGVQHPVAFEIKDVPLDFGAVDRQYRLFMMYEGVENLAERMVSEKLSESEAYGLLQKGLGILAQLHSHDIVHRDLKPSNIRLDAAGDPILVDFGVARDLRERTQTGSFGLGLIGSYQYMAPEVLFKGQKPGKAADLYSLGAAIIEALGGSPFAGDRTLATHRQALQKLGIQDSSLRTCLEALLTDDPLQRSSRFHSVNGMYLLEALPVAEKQAVLEKGVGKHSWSMRDMLSRVSIFPVFCLVFFGGVTHYATSSVTEGKVHEQSWDAVLQKAAGDDGYLDEDEKRKLVLGLGVPTIQEMDWQQQLSILSHVNFMSGVDIFLGKEVVGNIPCEALENYLQRK